MTKIRNTIAVTGVIFTAAAIWVEHHPCGTKTREEVSSTISLENTTLHFTYQYYRNAIHNHKDYNNRLDQGEISHSSCYWESGAVLEATYPSGDQIRCETQYDTQRLESAREFGYEGRYSFRPQGQFRKYKTQDWTYGAPELLGPLCTTLMDHGMKLQIQQRAEKEAAERAKEAALEEARQAELRKQEQQEQARRDMEREALKRETAAFLNAQ